MADGVNVPDAPGVPPVNRTPGADQPPPLATQDGVSSTGGSNKPQWGIYQNGALAVPADNAIAFDFKTDANVPDYTLEDGAFESYNKVQLPFNVRFKLTCGGSVAKRTAFLAALETAKQSLSLYDAVTPEKTFSSINVDHYDIRRTTEQGQTLIQAEVWALEIRINAAQAFSSTKSPSGSKTQSGGPVQTTPPTNDQQSKVQQHGASGSW